MLPVARWYDLQAENGRVMNYGAAASWAMARIAAMEGLPLPMAPSPEWAFDKFRLKLWPNQVAMQDQAKRIGGMVEQGLREGGIGLGIVPRYAPRSGYKELLAIQTLAAKFGVPTYSHVRSEGDVDPLSAAQAYGEMISLAAATGGHVHTCMIPSAQELGAAITVEAYP